MLLVKQVRVGEEMQAQARQTQAAVTPKESDVRTGEMPQFWYRRERIFRNGGGWYIRTREGIDVGPYPCRFDAEVEYEALVTHLQAVNSDRLVAVVNNYALAACSGESRLNTEAYTSYLVEEGGVELLRK